MVEKGILEEMIDALSELFEDIASRLSELETRIEHHANMIYNVLSPSLKKKLNVSDIIDIKINLKDRGIMSEHETSIITAFINEIIDEVYVN